MNSQIRIKIKKFRAIRNADISLNGITVVAGENGCGKSTVSKLLYQIYKSSNNYETIFKLDIRKKIYPFLEDIQEIERLISNYTRERSLYFKNSISRIIYNSDFSFFYEQEDKFQIGINELVEKLSHIDEKDAISIQKRLDRYIHSTLKNNKEIESLDFLSQVKLLLNSKLKSIKKELTGLKDKLEERPLSILNRIFLENFNSSSPKSLELFEHSSPLIDRELKRLNKSILVKEQIYIDTPMSVGIDFHVASTTFSHWIDLNVSLERYPKRGNLIKNPFQSLNNEVIYGDINVNEDDLSYKNKFIYKRKDGLKVDLLDCATGLKSFAILQLLYKNGTLQKDTLVIIDEPEAHLHPQWVVEYARLIVLLNKEIGVKFFIASHHPDMISAIKYISEKEKTEENLNFYLAKKLDGDYVYNYEYLGLDIEPIFESFNIALDRINQYGS